MLVACVRTACICERGDNAVMISFDGYIKVTVVIMIINIFTVIAYDH